jgi:hypothetical protein
MRHIRLLTGLVLASAAAAAVAGCSSAGTSAGTTSAHVSYKAPTAAVDLAKVCPSTVVIQQDWDPEAEHAAEYKLLGAGYTIDAARKRTSGPLVIDGMNTGVKIQIRAGGSAIGFQTVSSEMYVDHSITLGAVSTDGAIAAAQTQPVTAVVSPLEKSPQILFWDPATHPGWKSFADIGTSNAKVVVSPGSDFAELLVRKGLIKASQIDSSYNGSPARFVADPGIAEQGFATAEPYIYAHEVSAWDKPVKYELLANAGYNIYPEALSVRTGELPALTPCLKKLVPILQRAQVAYIDDPGPTDQLIAQIVKDYNDGWVYSDGVANYAAATMKKLGIVADDATGPVGGIDLSRVQSSISTFTPILRSSGAKIPAGLTAARIATDEFIDKSITLR